MASYLIGNAVRSTIKFKSVASGSYVDPTTVTAKVKNPGGTISTYIYGVNPELQKSSVGVYFLIIDCDQAGAWKYRWEATGDNQAAADGSFDVTASTF